MGGVTESLSSSGRERRRRNEQLVGLGGVITQENRTLFQQRQVRDTAGAALGRESGGQTTAFTPAAAPAAAAPTAAAPATQAAAPDRPRSSALDAGTSGRRRRRSALALTLGLAQTTKKSLLGT